jgi:hypothetical protein
MTANAKRWQQSYSGKVVTPYDLRPEQVTFDDIGHALAQKIRFNGQCTVMGYTVAQHCVLGAIEIAKQKKSADLAMAFMLHELGEVYLPDVPTPIKALLSVHLGIELVPWGKLEELHAAVILKAIGLPEMLPVLDDPVIHDTDTRMLMTEKRDLLGPEPQPWGFTELPYPTKIIDIWEPPWAEDCWNTWFRTFKSRLSKRPSTGAP